MININLLALFPRETVDNATLPGIRLLDQFQHTTIVNLLRFWGQDILEVDSVETRDKPENNQVR